MGYTCPEHVFLHADHISKIYPGTKALDDVSFDLLKGKVNVLIGENGAGKSTLMKMIAGIEHPSEGKMYIGDQEVSFKDTTEARKHGIGIIHQELSLFPNLNVYQNIFMAREKTLGKIKLDNKSHIEATKKILKRLEHEIDPNTQVGCCIVSQDNKILSMGYNGFPKGCSDDEFPWGREGDPLDTKYLYVTHSELNAILNYRGGSLEGAKLYVSLFPCNECAKAIIQAGIRTIVYDCDKYADTPSVIASKKMLDAAGVRYYKYNRTDREITIKV